MGSRVSRNRLATSIVAAAALAGGGCGDGAKEEDSMAPLLEKAAREQGIDSNTVKSRGNEMPQGDPKQIQKAPDQDSK